ncbi:M28 family peptidase [Niabella terrae]
MAINNTLYSKLFVGLLMFLGTSVYGQQNDTLFIRKLADEILQHSTAYAHLRVLTKEIGGRLAGSPQMYQAEDWGYRLLDSNGSEHTFKQETLVPHWVRGGKDEAQVLLPGGDSRPLQVIALGNSLGSGPEGVSGQLVLVRSFEELEQKKDQLKGKIVFYNYHFNPRLVRVFEAYGDAVTYRTRGASRAAKYGAVGVLIRSMSGSTDNVPHTGGMYYDENYPKIPALALGLQDADRLAEQLTDGKTIRVQMKSYGAFLPEVPGHNIIGELRGTEHPEQYITVGGHLDSWDNCEGAHDDGAGIVQTAEILRAFRALGYRPRHTIRFVFFANEENGLRGGTHYAEQAQSRNEQHIFALESDAGGFTPRGFGCTGTDAQLAKLQSWAPLLQPYGGGEISSGGGGADITPLHRLLKTPMGELLPDSQRYFDMHHSTNDVFEIVNKRELELGAVNMAALIYLIDQHGI